VGPSERIRYGILTSLLPSVKPKASALPIFVVFAVIAITQGVLMYFLFTYFTKRTEVIAGLPTQSEDALAVLLEDRRFLYGALAATLSGHVFGGFAAGRLPHKANRIAYKNAFAGALLYGVVGLIALVRILTASGEPISSQSDAGTMLLSSLPPVGLSLGATWLVLEISRRPERTERAAGLDKLLRTSGTSRSVSIAAVALLTLVPLSAIMWVLLQPSLASQGRCLNPPTVATFNYWPVSYSGEPCHDWPTLDARVAGPKAHWSWSAESATNGVIAKKDDIIEGLVWINNGAIPDGEQRNPGRGIARNVRVRLEFDDAASNVHELRVTISADNATSKRGSFGLSRQKRIDSKQYRGAAKQKTTSIPFSRIKSTFPTERCFCLGI
jgi:hypothetical protein